MTRGEMLRKLEALLDRVRTRAGEPRGAPQALRSADVEPPSASAVGRAPSALHGTMAEQTTEDAPPSDLRDSRERLVAAEPGPPEPLHAEPAKRVQESAPPIDVAELEVSEEEAAEEPPLSSRRPVAPEPEERIAQIAFGAEEPREPTIHTPPPESGRLPAAPVAEFEPDPDVTAVRNATPLLPRTQAARAPVELTPEAIRPQPVPNDTVAEVIAEAQRFSPQTFVALLDASLSL